jgi:hypothetical protein
VFLDEGYCSAAQVEIDPDTGCNTYSPNAEPGTGDDWDDDDELEEWEELDEEDTDEDEDIWPDDDETE